MLVDLEEAVRYLHQSQPVAIPTETVWGLAAKANDETGIFRIFTLKDRPPQNPLIIHVSTLDSIFEYTTLPREVLDPLIHAFWPGGLTLVIPIHENRIPSMARAGLPTAAFRMPDHPTARALIERTGPLVAPSANRSGRPSGTTVEHIEKDFGLQLPILKTTVSCRYGIESTILIWKENLWHIGRFGALSPTLIKKVLGYEPQPQSEVKKPLCPGQLFRHYAPKAALTLSFSPWNPENARHFDGVLGFSNRHYLHAQTVVTMGDSNISESVAARLYAALRELDVYGLRSVFVDLHIPTTPEWMAVIDRLQKASKG